MPFVWRDARLSVLAVLVTWPAAGQYSTPVGTGAAKPATLCATAVLEWTGSLNKPNASRLMPVAVWDGEHYQPAGLYLAQPAPLAFETGTEYVLERAGEPAGLFDVRGAAQLDGDWIGMGRFRAEVKPPVPKLKPSRHLPVLSNGREKPAASDKAGASGPTLHRKADADAGTTASSSSGSAGGSGNESGGAGSASTGADPDRPTLHKRSGSGDASTPDANSQPAGASSGASTSTAGTGSSTDAGADPDRPTLHKHTDTDTDTADAGSSGQGGGSSSSPDTDAPTLHKRSDQASASAPEADPDRPTLHRGRSSGAAGLVTSSGSIDPDRPRLRYGKPETGDAAVLPAQLVGAPPTMQQIVAVSDVANPEPRSYLYHWASPDDAAKMETALAAMAAQVAVQALRPASFAPARRSAARPGKTAKPAASPAPPLVDPSFKAYELTFSGGATVVYSAHSADEGPRRVYVTLIAQPDFYGHPQVLFKQAARADRLDATPAMRLVDAVDTDGDGRAELIFELNGSEVAQAPVSGSSADPQAERQFAIYRVANGAVAQVFATGPLP